MHKLFELISLAATPSTILMSLFVVACWLPSALRAHRAETVDARGWFIVGVTVAFLGGSIDNLYWGIAWSSSFLELEVKEQLFGAGVYSNIPARQLAGTFAAYCHIRAAYVGDGGRMANRWVFWTTAVGIVFVSILVLVKM